MNLSKLKVVLLWVAFGVIVVTVPVFGFMLERDKPTTSSTYREQSSVVRKMVKPECLNPEPKE